MGTAAGETICHPPTPPGTRFDACRTMTERAARHGRNHDERADDSLGASALPGLPTPATRGRRVGLCGAGFLARRHTAGGPVQGSGEADAALGRQAAGRAGGWGGVNLCGESALETDRYRTQRFFGGSGKGLAMALTERKRKFAEALLARVSGPFDYVKAGTPAGRLNSENTSQPG